MLPKIVQNVIVPLFVLYVEYYKGSGAAQYGFVPLYAAYVLDVLMDKHLMEHPLDLNQIVA